MSVTWTKILRTSKSWGIALVRSELGTWITSTYFVKKFLLSGRPSRGSWAGGCKPHVMVEP